MLNQHGQIEAKLHFDAFGQQTSIAQSQWSDAAQANAAITLIPYGNISQRGYTGHEHVSACNIIHMNGRIYDPHIARMLQADPFVQAPDLILLKP